MSILRRHFAWTLSLLIAAPLASQAEPPTTATATITIDCDHRYISQRDAARVLHTDNFWQTYAERQSLYANVARLCQAGMDEVLLLTREREPKPRAIAIASR